MRRLERHGRALRLTCTTGRTAAGDEPNLTTEPTAMTTQIDIFGSDQDWTVPALLVVLMTILAMLGIVANVAVA